jgi:hypothetical protein
MIEEIIIITSPLWRYIVKHDSLKINLAMKSRFRKTNYRDVDPAIPDRFKFPARFELIVVKSDDNLRELSKRYAEDGYTVRYKYIYLPRLEEERWRKMNEIEESP